MDTIFKTVIYDENAVNQQQLELMEFKRNKKNVHFSTDIQIYVYRKSSQVEYKDNEENEDEDEKIDGENPDKDESDEETCEANVETATSDKLMEEDTDEVEEDGQQMKANM